MKKIDAHITLSNGEFLLCGQIVVHDSDPQGRLSSQFRYDEGYLRHPKAFAIDPIHLPLNESTFKSSDPYSGLHGVFSDALPDAWGRRVMSKNPAILEFRRSFGLPLRMRDPDMLEWVGRGGLGSLCFSASGENIRTQTHPLWADLPRLLVAASIVESEQMDNLDEVTASFWDAGSPSGGARPKVLMPDMLVKFPSKNDTWPVLLMEHVVMLLSERAGLDTAKTHFLTSSPGQDILAVERFDQSCSPGGRYHLLSAETLLGVQSFNHLTSYRDLATIIKDICVDPEKDLQKLYRQMVCNIVFGNTDDHLKNFAFMYDGTGYTLTPAYDIVPYFGAEHALRFDLDAAPPGRETLIKIGESFEIERNACKCIISTVIESAGYAKEVLDTFEIEDRQKGRFVQLFERRSSELKPDVFGVQINLEN
ncbi:MAG: type II toxin-antitoxin system HipA family toxin [Marinospirillum sp.]|uniref:type II toxin-antitoxin system HipA family toxin n=1 Tax=Marinospirillum sp. TaxID=2183934 RepID=UPI0019EF4016|nr:type II toxin-antitoxin system HipA family toxin [Marinospirillum sp.]MBE0507336.1 type II toxin-antitoxin system HipA family toxin [Marinospirillum sp.]